MLRPEGGGGGGGGGGGVNARTRSQPCTPPSAASSDSASHFQWEEFSCHLKCERTLFAS